MYNVAVLFETELHTVDADQIVALHEGVDDVVRYHLVLPVVSPDVTIGASMAAFSSGQFIPITEPDVL